ncbi:hypothetical protein RhiirA5_442059 [Rhizophagus irregularis]|uniref:Uncharacterized protein n=1 Tax=Rhizophagus irregularis TaxID=588596 RepID=A0A2N0NF38_9GLOM|nr:hypothetical protein RhiirA5_442059 [Rhizophagus irregularis]
MSFDDFNLYWKKHLIPGGLRAWRKKCSELIWKNEMLNIIEIVTVHHGKSKKKMYGNVHIKLKIF